MTSPGVFRATAAWLVALTSLALVARLPPAMRPGLWVDEVFSLAMTTGHSVEHQPRIADPRRGDFVAPTMPRRASLLAAYAQPGLRTTPLGDITRAVAMSDTNPPLYYLLLSGWLRVAGTGDAALRSFSTACALACVPLVWLIASSVRNHATAVVATAMFAVSPVAIYYSAEGRMYALTWLFGLGLASLTLRLHHSAQRRVHMAAWVIVAAGGLLTHYFFAFVWLACGAWLLAVTEPRRRVAIASLVAVAMVVASPWYAKVPATLSQWRVTAGWLDGSMTAGERAVASGKLVHGLLFWGGAPISLYVSAILSFLIAILVIRHWHVHAGQKVLLLWAWAAASIAGLLAVDVWQGTRAVEYLRYAQPALPAALILMAIVVTTATRWQRLVIGLAIGGVWWHAAAVSVYTTAARPFQPLPDVARQLRHWQDAGVAPPLVIVHSIPTGIIGLARYMEPATDVYPSIVRVNHVAPRDDIDRITAPYRRFAFIRFHDLGVASSFEGWLADHARRDGGEQIGGVRIDYYTRRPTTGGG